MLFLLGLFAAVTAKKLDFNNQNTYDAYFGSPTNAEKDALRKSLFDANKTLLSYKIVNEFANKMGFPYLHTTDKNNPFSSFVITNQDILTAIAVGTDTVVSLKTDDGKSVLRKLKEYLVTKQAKLEDPDDSKLIAALHGFKIPEGDIGKKGARILPGNIVESLTTDSGKFFTENKDLVTCSVVKNLSKIMKLNIDDSGNSINGDNPLASCTNAYATWDTEVLKKIDAGVSEEPVKNNRVADYLLASINANIEQNTKLPVLTKEVVSVILGTAWNAPNKENACEPSHLRTALNRLNAHLATNNKCKEASVDENTVCNAACNLLDGYFQHQSTNDISLREGLSYVCRRDGDWEPINGEDIQCKKSPSSSIPMALGSVLILIAAVY